MKIEMGESLFYSWLRHVKECQIVQTNWKVSSQWELLHRSELETFINKVDSHFSNKYNYKIFKQNASLSQIIQQGECDVIGTAIYDGETKFYAVDVAFHEAGLNYGTKDETIMKVIAKSIRTAALLYGYVNTKKAEIIFASPKINAAILNELSPCIEDVNVLFANFGFDFSLRLICNEDFNDVVLQPILMVSDGVADTSELFLRSYQMFNMFAHNKNRTVPVRRNNLRHTTDYVDESQYKELKVGKLAKVVLGRILEEGHISSEELINLQRADYSKTIFDLQYPLLVKEGSEFDSVRYYSQPIKIHGEFYYLCSQWFETYSNNDRPYLISWIESHTKE